MPRGRKAGTVTETLAQQIEKAQQKVIKTRQHTNLQWMLCRNF